MNIKAAVVGVGHLGGEHARIYKDLPGVSLEVVCDVRKGRVQEIAGKFRTGYLLDYKQIPSDIKAVSIAVPTEGHYEVAKFFLGRGTNVLLEKPVTEKVSEAQSLLSLAKRSGSVFQVGHIERFNAGVVELQRRVKRPRFIESHRLGPYQGRCLDVGVVLDTMIHDIDIVLSLVNSPVRHIDAVGVGVFSPNEDIASARLTFLNGAVANITASRISDERMRRIRIFEDNAYLCLDYITQGIDVYKRVGRKIVRRKLSPLKKEPLKLELRDFIDCIRKKKRPLVSGLEGKRALEVALQISRKIKNRQK